MLQWRRPYLVGIDYHDTQINAVMLQTSTSILQLKPLMPQRELHLLLKQLHHQYGRVTVMLNVPAQHLLQQEVAIDLELNTDDIQFYIEENCPHWFNTSAKNLFYDWEVFHPDLQFHHRALRICAMLRDYLQPLINVCRDHNIKVHSVETNVHALMRFLQHQQLLSSRLTGLVLHNDSTLTLAVAQQHNLLYLQHYKNKNLQHALQQFDAQYPHFAIDTLYTNCNALAAEAQMIDCSTLFTIENAATYASAAGSALRGYV